MKIFVITAFLLIFFTPLRAQKMFVSSGQVIKSVNVTTTGCLSDIVPACPNQNYFAIAVHNTDFYYTTNTDLFHATLTNGVISGCSLLDILPAPMTAMTVDKNGVIFTAAGNALYKFDPAGGQVWVLIGAMPYTSSGDMLFYKGDLYMASTLGIVKVDTITPSASTLHIPMTRVLYGMAVLSVDCNENKVYGFEVINAGLSTNIIELDLDNKLVVGTTCTLPYSVDDAASDVESGTLSDISIREVKVLPQCNVPGKGAIHVIREPGLSVYTYTIGAVSNTTGIFENLNPGNYNIHVVSAGGCIKDLTATVPLFNVQHPIVTIHQQDPDCVAGGKLFFEMTPDNGNYKIIHNNKDTVPSSFQFQDLAEGLHHFDYMDEFDCVYGSTDITFSLKGPCDTVFFPNAFTPNNDGLNDLFRGSGNSSIRDYRLSVFNRWGQVVFTTNNISSGWNGRLGVLEEPAGVYVWMATYVTRAGVFKRQKGTVAIIR